MPRSWLEDMVTACNVDVTYLVERQVGFFVGPTKVLTHFNLPPIAAESPRITGRREANSSTQLFCAAGRLGRAARTTRAAWPIAARSGARASGA
jgi:hypothetical protein